MGHILCSQIDEVLSKDSAEELDKGNNPGPMTEIQFWKAKCENLESLYDQVNIVLDWISQYCDGQH